MPTSNLAVLVEFHHVGDKGASFASIEYSHSIYAMQDGNEFKMDIGCKLQALGEMSTQFSFAGELPVRNLPACNDGGRPELHILSVMLEDAFEVASIPCGNPFLSGVLRRGDISHLLSLLVWAASYSIFHKKS